MRYISVCCVVGIIAGFCIGPGKLFYTAYLQKDKILERTLDKKVIKKATLTRLHMATHWVYLSGPSIIMFMKVSMLW